MSFLYPAFLFGLLSLAIPVIIHLFNLQRPKEIIFTNVAFLKNVQEVTTSRLKLKHLLVLLCRLLFLFFLVMAFAQPVLKNEHSELLSGDNHVSLYIDNSYSMENQIDGNQALDLATSYVTSLSRFFSPSTNYSLLTNDFERADLSFKNFDKLQERITELNYSPKFRSLNDILVRERSLSGQVVDNNRFVFIFSDFQKSTLGDLNDLSLDTTVRYFIVPLQNKEVANLYVDSVWLTEPLVQVNTNITIKTRIRNSGSEAAEKVNVRLFFDDVQMNNTVVDLEPFGEKVIDFSFTMKDSVAKRGIVRVEDSPVQFDNNYYFIVGTSPKVRVYQIYQDNRSIIDHVYQNSTVFSLESAAVGEVDYSAIGQADLIVLNGVNVINRHLSDVLQRRVQEGATLVLFPGGDPDVVSYGNLLQRVRVDAFNADTSDKKGYVLASPDVRDPFFKDVFEKEDKNLNLPYAYPVIKSSVKGKEILGFRNGLSFLSGYHSGERGMIYVFTSPLDKHYSNFYQHALFVPVMYRLAFLSATSIIRPAYSFQERMIIIPLDTISEAIFSIEDEEDKYVPVQKLIDNKLYLELPTEDLKPGFYWLSDGKRRLPIALNAATAESAMDFYSMLELKQVFKGKNNMDILETDSAEDFYSMFKNKNIGIALWKYCLILSLIFLLSEILFIRFL